MVDDADVAVCVCRVCAVFAQSFAESSPQLSRQLGRVSMTLSLAGIAVSLFTVAVIVASGGFHGRPPLNGTAANGTVDDYVRSPRTLCCLKL